MALGDTNVCTGPNSYFLIFSIVYRDFSAFAIPDKIIGAIGAIPALKFYVAVGNSNVGTGPK
jgi:hypothetical protein